MIETIVWEDLVIWEDQDNVVMEPVVEAGDPKVANVEDGTRVVEADMVGN